MEQVNETVNEKEIAAAKKKKDRKQYWNDVKKSIIKNKALYIMFIPVIVWYILFCYLPMFGIVIAFNEFDPSLGMFKSPWVGLKHFERFFKSYYFVRLVKNTFGISLYALVVGLPLPIILALLFNEVRNRKLRTLFQTLSYAPHFLSTVIIVGILMIFLSPTTGVVNGIRAMMGLKSINYLTDPNSFWNLYVWSGVWQNIGWDSVIYSAAISGIPSDQYEAALIDGANKLQRMWYITIPEIMPTIIVITILSMGSVMNVGYEKVFLMQNDMNLSSSEVISTYVYKNGLINQDYSFSTAVGLFNNIISFVLLVVVNKFAQKKGDTSLW